MRWLFFSIVLLVSACKDSNQGYADWGYMVGSNADEIWHTKADFYRNDKPIHGSSSGAIRSVSIKSLQIHDYKWDIGKGHSGENQLVPNRVNIEWISFHDKKRYGINLALPEDLGEKINARYRVKVGKGWREEQRNIIGIGLAPGGYVEVFLTNSFSYLKPDILLVRGVAQEVETLSDKKKPVTQVYKAGFEEFNSTYGNAFRQYPTPLGLEWAPVMDAYRAAQPRTDTHPLN